MQAEVHWRSELSAVDRAELAAEAAEVAALHAAAAAAVATMPPRDSPPPDRVQVAELRRRTQSLMDEARRVLDVSDSSREVTGEEVHCGVGTCSTPLALGR